MPPDKEDKAAPIALSDPSLARRNGQGEADETNLIWLGQEERSRLLCGATIDIAAALFDIPAAELRRHGRATRKIARVRQIAMYAAHTMLGLSQREVGIAFERDRTTVVHACHTVEDLRDDRNFDQAVMLLEAILMAAFRTRLEAPWR